LKIILILLPLLLAFGPFDSPKGLVEEGNLSFETENLDDALGSYDRALKLSKDASAIEYNKANTLVKKGELEEALKSYRKAASTGDDSQKERAYYNMGNALYRSEKFKEAAGSYKEALKADPQDKDAKANLEMTLQKIQEQKQDSENKGDDKNKDKNEDKDKKKDGEPEDGDSQKDSKPEDGDKQKDKQGDKKEEEGQQNKGDDEQKNQSGKDADKKIASALPELVLMDYHIPSMNGFEIFERMKSNPATAKTAVIFVSGKMTEKEKITALKMGASDIVTRPYGAGEFLARVKRIVDVE